MNILGEYLNIASIKIHQNTSIISTFLSLPVVEEQAGISTVDNNQGLNEENKQGIVEITQQETVASVEETQPEAEVRFFVLCSLVG